MSAGLNALKPFWVLNKKIEKQLLLTMMNACNHKHGCTIALIKSSVTPIGTRNIEDL